MRHLVPVILSLLFSALFFNKRINRNSGVVVVAGIVAVAALAFTVREVLHIFDQLRSLPNEIASALIQVIGAIIAAVVGAVLTVRLTANQNEKELSDPQLIERSLPKFWSSPTGEPGSSGWFGDPQKSVAPSGSTQTGRDRSTSPPLPATPFRDGADPHERVVNDATVRPVPARNGDQRDRPGFPGRPRSISRPPAPAAPAAPARKNANETRGQPGVQQTGKTPSPPDAHLASMANRLEAALRRPAPPKPTPAPESYENKLAELFGRPIGPRNGEANGADPKLRTNSSASKAAAANPGTAGGTRPSLSGTRRTPRPGATWNETLPVHAAPARSSSTVMGCLASLFGAASRT